MSTKTCELLLVDVMGFEDKTSKFIKVQGDGYLARSARYHCAAKPLERPASNTDVPCSAEIRPWILEGEEERVLGATAKPLRSIIDQSAVPPAVRMSSHEFDTFCFFE